MKEETGLSGEPELLTIQHRLRGPSRDEIKLDHYFFIFMVNNPKGELINTQEGNNFWKTLEEIKELNTFPGFEYSLNTIQNKKVEPYEERFIQVNEI